MKFLDYLLPRQENPIFLDPEINKIGSIRENIITLKRGEEYESKALFRTYYLENKVVVVVSRFDSYGISNMVEYFVQKFCYENGVSSDNLTLYEVVDPILKTEVTLRRFTSVTDINKENISHILNPEWKETLSIEEFEKIIGKKFETTYYKSLKSLDHLKTINESRLKIIQYSMSALHSIEGLYELIPTFREGEIPFKNQINFYNNLKKIIIKCEKNKIKEMGGANFKLEIDKYPEHFYKISEKFANKFDEFEFDGFRLENDFIIARSNLEKLIVEKFMRYNGVKLSNIIDEDEKLNLHAVASYVLCTNLTAFELKIIPINLQ